MIFKCVIVKGAIPFKMCPLLHNYIWKHLTIHLVRFMKLTRVSTYGDLGGSEELEQRLERAERGGLHEDALLLHLDPLQDVLQGVLQVLLHDNKTHP